MPLAQTITGVRAAIRGASVLATERTACAGTTSSIAWARAASASSPRARWRHRAVRPAGKGFRALRQMRGVCGIVLPERDLASGARAGQRQRRAPGACSNHSDVVERHEPKCSPSKRFAAQQLRHVADESPPLRG